MGGYAVEFDVFRNDLDDTTSNSRHVAVHQIDNAARLVEVTNPPFFYDGRWHTWDLTFTGPLLSLTMDDTNTIFDQQTLPIGLGEQVWLGFTAATSNRLLQIAIDDVWIGCPNSPEGPVEPDDTGE